MKNTIRMKGTLNRRSSASLLLLLWSSGAGLLLSLSAHEEKTLLTDVFFNERAGNLEIAHRINIHDAEHVLRRQKQLPDNLIDSKNAQSLFADYVTKIFQLTNKDGSIINLSLVGQEIEGGHFWVYQEIPITRLPGRAFKIQNSILSDEVKQQTNTVNVRFRSHVSTFVFKAGSEAKLYERPEN